MYSSLCKHSSYRKSLFLDIAKCNLKGKYFSGNAADDHNVKKFKLLKRVASTVLFGGTFLAVLWAKKRKRFPIFDDAKFVKNPFYNNNNFKMYEYKGYILPTFVMKNLMNVQSFTCRENDIFVLSYPKTGTTWLQEIIYCVLKGIEPSFSKSIEDRFPYLEFVYPGLSSIEKNSDQRLIKTHLPYSLMPSDVHSKKPKIFCILRNPKDVAVSYYHFVRMMTISNYSGSFYNFYEDFISDKVPYGPIWKHYKEIWDLKNEPNIFVLSYEDLHQDIHSCIKKVAEFLGKDLSEMEIEAIAEHCSFENMSQNPNVNYQHWDDLGIRNKDEAKFMRKGKVGDWRNYFSPDMNQAMDLLLDEKMKEIMVLFPDDSPPNSLKQN